MVGLDAGSSLQTPSDTSVVTGLDVWSGHFVEHERRLVRHGEARTMA
jgi:hypothetical protein